MDREPRADQQLNEEDPDGVKISTSVHNATAEPHDQSGPFDTHGNDVSNQEMAALISQKTQLIQVDQSSNTTDMNIHAEKGQHPSLHSKPQRSNFKWLWIPEWLSLFLAFGSFISIVALLWVFHQRVQPHWRHNITINAVVAVLATSLRACLAMVSQEGK